MTVKSHDLRVSFQQNARETCVIDALEEFEQRSLSEDDLVTVCQLQILL